MYIILCTEYSVYKTISSAEEKLGDIAVYAVRLILQILHLVHDLEHGSSQRTDD